MQCCGLVDQQRFDAKPVRIRFRLSILMPIRNYQKTWAKSIFDKFQACTKGPRRFKHSKAFLMIKHPDPAKTMTMQMDADPQHSFNTAYSCHCVWKSKLSDARNVATYTTVLYVGYSERRSAPDLHPTNKKFTFWKARSSLKRGHEASPKAHSPSRSYEK